MIEKLGYPKEMISIERRLSSLPHLSGKKVPNRRFDILCFTKDLSLEHALYPLLMIECKAHPITQRAMEQIIGYNDYVSACFIGVANQERVVMGYRCIEKASYEFFEGMPSYADLLQVLKPQVLK